MPRRIAGFVGRADELATLRACIARAVDGAPVLVLVAGEAGVGKSRLLGRVAEEATRDGVIVLRSWCAPVVGAGVAFGPVTGLLREAVGRRPDLLGFIRDQVPDAGHLIPTGGPAPSPLTGELTQVRLLEAVHAVLREIARIGPVLVVVEDVQWADRASGEALAYLAGPAQPTGTVIAVSYRTEDLPRHHHLHPVLRELDRVPHADRIDLRPFRPPELAQQLADLLGQEPTGDLVREMAERSGGNPFFVEELWSARLRGETQLPSSLGDLLATSLDPLPVPVRRLVRVAAAIGRDVHPELLERCVGPDLDGPADRLRAAVDAGVLVASGERLAFRHELLREAAYGTLLPGEQPPVHAAIARALAERPDLAAGGRADGELAHHWRLAGDPGRALAAAVRAMRQARALGALTEAAQHGLRALELWDAVPDAAHTVDRVDLLLRIADDSLLGGGTPAQVWAQRALDVIDPAAEPARHAVVTAQLARYELIAGHPDRALEIAAGAEEAAERLADPATRARVAADHAQVLLNTDRCAASRARAELALALAREVADPVLEARAGALLGADLCALGEWTRGLTMLRDVSAAAEALTGDGAAEARAYAAVIESVYLNLFGFPLASLEQATTGLTRASADGLDLSFGTALRATAAVAAVAVGRPDRAEELLDDAPRPGVRRFVQFRAEARTALALVTGDLDGIGRDLAETAGDDLRAPIWLCFTGAAELALASHELAAARAEVARLLGHAQERGLAWLIPRVAAIGLAAESGIAARATAAGDPAAARESRQVADALAAALAEAEAAALAVAGAQAPAPAAWTAVARAWHERVWQRPDVPAWRKAVDAADSARLPLVAAIATLELGKAFLAAGDRPAAAEALAAAERDARSLGAQRIAAKARTVASRARLRDAAAERADGRGSGDRLGLTARELQVLALISDGRTNREIGESLFMSPKTASVHVTNLLRKLDVPDRREAGRAARRLGLVQDPD